MKAPNRLDFTPEEIDALIYRLDNKCLQEGDYSLLTDILRAMIWLSFSLQEKELSIKRLRKIFGIKTESAKKLLEMAHGKSLNDSSHDKTDNDTAETNQVDEKSNEISKGGSKASLEAQGELEQDASKEKKKKNHGHRPSSDYQQAKTVFVAHQTLKKGDICPDCLKGRLYSLKPGTVLRIVGQPWLQVEIYQPERLRCSLCNNIFKAMLPLEVATGSRADFTAKAIVSFLKYCGGIPFYRQGQIQEVLGTPISASEIFEMTEDVADALQPVYAVLCKEAAHGELLHNDDTTARILSRMKELQSEDNERTGTFTTCIIAVLNTVQICLFFTGKAHAGENLDEILEMRDEDLPPPIQQCDALSRNVPENHNTQLSNCLAHCRRKFYELVDVWPQEVTQIIGYFSSVFAHDHEAPEDPQNRLKWHQEKSAPIMQEMKEFCNNLIKHKKVEPNSSMGKAIAYLNNHWEAFTLFLRVPGVPLTNNVSERMIKTVVLNRKNAYFYRNETGAKIGDIIMSTIQTCILNNVNPNNYLVAIQQHEKDVHRNPTLWLPWLYEKRLNEMQSTRQPPQCHPP